jgi:glycosyltransferase involved in cell wall biosynthesis
MIDIVVASWNCASRLIGMVDSVRANSRWPWRMFVVDNASEDGAAEWLAAQPDLRVTLSRENLGFSRATNAGVAESLLPQHGDAEWTVLMNNDVAVPRHWDKVMLNALAKRPRVRVCSPLLTKVRGRAGRPGHPLRAMLRREWVGFSCAFVHKDAWREYGPLRSDGGRWHFGSDREFCLRLAGGCWRVATYTGLAVEHWHGASRAYIRRRRQGKKASQGDVWAVADEMYAANGRVDAEEIGRMLRASMPEIRNILSLWLDRLRIERRRVS